jgi:arsenic resistance protein ArsH
MSPVSLINTTDLPNIDRTLLDVPSKAQLDRETVLEYAPRILILYGSLRQRSFSRFLALEAARLLETMGCEVKVFHADGLPLPDDEPDSHAKVVELRELALWSEGMVWCTPERHGAMTGIMKAQIDWIPLSSGAVRPTQGKTLALLQVSGGSQSFNAVNLCRRLFWSLMRRGA